MWNTVDRIVEMISDLTVGTVIVLVHVALADRESARTKRMAGTPGPAFEETDRVVIAIASSLREAIPIGR